MLKSKIHRATVTDSHLTYEGSITIDRELLEAGDILPFEAVDVWNLSNGSRFETYTIVGEPGSGTICINGAAAHLAAKGDLVIIASWMEMAEDETGRHQPRLVFVDEANRVSIDG